MGRPVDRLTWTVPEVAAALGCSHTTVGKMIERGDIPAVFIGRRALVPKKALEEWLAENAAAGRRFAGRDSARSPSGPAA